MTTPILDTASNDLTNDECMLTDGSMPCFLPRLCLVHTVNCFANFQCSRGKYVFCQWTKRC